MPELPEVETVRRGLEPLVVGKRLKSLEIREPRLRWPIDPALAARVEGQRIESLDRRGKYLLIRLSAGALIVHLGMSGSLRHVAARSAPALHDHFDLLIDGSAAIRFNDPRRFGSLHYADEPLRHPLLSGLGPEPLGAAFDADYLHAVCRGRKVAIKSQIMNSRIVAGVGNIYANEALFPARIHPARAAGRISKRRIEDLVAAIRSVLESAIRQGGTTLRDFVGSDGRPGYFKQSLAVYDREGEPCRRCGEPIRVRVIGQRASYYCPRCQR